MLLAQISDIHADPEADYVGRLDRALHFIARLQPAAVLVSGDLVDDAWREGYEVIANRLKQLTTPVLVIPGNADDPDLLREQFDLSFPGPLTISHRLGGLHLIGLDSTVAGSSAGDIRPQLDFLRREREGATDPWFLFLHHHLLPSGIDAIDQSMAAGADALSGFFQSHMRPLGITCGHTHRPAVSVMDGVPITICGSICRQNPLELSPDFSLPDGDDVSLLVHKFTGQALVSHFISL